MKNKKLILGAHVSIAGGIDNAIRNGESINCNAIQIFTKSNRQWQAKKLNEDEVEKFKTKFKESKIEFVVVHASYLINIASSKKELLEKSYMALAEELTRCDLLGIPYLIIHPGSNDNIEAGINNIAHSINNIYRKHDFKTILLLENMAGQGNSVCYKLEHLTQIYSQIEYKEKIGICIDLCHLFSAGYDFRTKEKYEYFWNEFDKTLGIESLKVLHINDSKKDLGSRVDRHEFIGKGKIGKEAFELLFNDKKLFNVIKILETPVNSLNEYTTDLKYIISLLNDENLKLIKDSSLSIYK